MKFESDDFNFKDQIEILNIHNQMQQKTVENSQTIGFNCNKLYSFIENTKQ